MEGNVDNNGVILLVDDTPANLDLLKEYLNGQGYKILIAKNGETALTRARAARPDIILLDVMMPGMDGFETCRQLKADETTWSIPVIFMTALSSPQDKVRAFSLGAVDYVTKPLEQQEVIARVRAHLANYRYATRLEAMVAQRTQALADVNALLQRHEQRKADFIRIMSHELRTPLSLVMGYVDMLGANAPQEIVQGIKHGANRLKDIVNEILDVAWLDANAVPFDARPVDVKNLAELLVFQWSAAIEERQLEVHVDMAGLPVIEADAEHLKKVFEHLLLNAIKFTPDGGRITIAGTVSGDQRHIEISVRDTGIGIDPQDHKTIFDKFFETGYVMNHSSGKTKFKGGGAGLGLTIARGLVRAHRGDIWVESEGHDETTCPGSAFIVRLPICQP